MRRHINDQERRYTELFSGLVLKGLLNRLEVPPIQETHIRAQSRSYCNIQIQVRRLETTFLKNPQPVKALGSFVVYILTVCFP